MFCWIIFNYRLILYYSIYSDDSEDGLDDNNPLLPESGDPLIQVKEEPPNSLLGETSGASNSGLLNPYSLNGVLQSGQCGVGFLWTLSSLGAVILSFFFFFILYVSLSRIKI